jgi:hypothetical protein
VALYSGPFLDGFYVSDAPEFERWTEAERARLARLYVRALEDLARDAASRHDVRGVAEWWRRAATADPVDSRLALNYMKALVAVGDRAAALRHAQVHEALIRQELRTPPDENVRAYARQIRAEVPGEPSRGAPSVGAAGQTIAAAPTSGTRKGSSPEGQRATPVRMLTSSVSHSLIADQDDGAPRGPVVAARAALRRREFRYGITGSVIAVVVVALALTLALVTRPKAGATANPPVIAVGSIREYGGTDTSGIVRALGEMLSTNIARIPSLRVISNSRLYEVLGQLSVEEPQGQRLLRAAKRTGATEVVEGSLYQRGAQALRFDLRRVDLATGAVRGAYSVEGKDLFALVDSATALLARDLGRSGSGEPLSVAAVTTPSLVAQRFYEEGLRALYQVADPAAALRLFQLALREDSSFAMAAFYFFKVAPILGDSNLVPVGLRALTLATNASERERLLINADIREVFNDPLGAVYADSLIRRFPGELDGAQVLAATKVDAGDFLGAVPLLRYVIATDSLSLGHPKSDRVVRCRACEAYHALVDAYWRADSLPVAQRVAREYAARRSWSADAVDL